MSRSYRKPYSAITGRGSAKEDKRIARQAVRRMENQRIRNCKDLEDYENLVMPDRLDCAYNETYSWGRDGKQYLHFPPEPLKSNSDFDMWWFEYQTKYYARLHRK